MCLVAGREYNGSAGNAFVLDDTGKPHNPLIDVGGMFACSLIRVSFIRRHCAHNLV